MVAGLINCWIGWLDLIAGKELAGCWHDESPALAGCRLAGAAWPWLLAGRPVPDPGPGDKAMKNKGRV